MASLEEDPGMSQPVQEAHGHEQQIVEHHHGMQEDPGIHSVQHSVQHSVHPGHPMHEDPGVHPVHDVHSVHGHPGHPGHQIHPGHPGHEDVDLDDQQYDEEDPMAVRDPNTKQLTLSYQGEVYVFDTVPPEKVQAVLLLLGSQETPAGLSLAQLGKQGYDLPSRLNQPMRLASLQRFREKRKERNYDKKIRYSVRKEVAQRMQRKKGQFASNRPQPSEDGSGSGEFSGQPQQEMMCTNCGIGEKQTPMMRRGPHGPGTLCNACGLQWASKGALRDTRKDKQQREQHMDGHHHDVHHPEYLPQLLPGPMGTDHQALAAQQGQELGQQLQVLGVPDNQLTMDAGVLSNAPEMAPPIANGSAPLS